MPYFCSQTTKTKISMDKSYDEHELGIEKQKTNLQDVRGRQDERSSSENSSSELRSPHVPRSELRSPHLPVHSLKREAFSRMRMVITSNSSRKRIRPSPVASIITSARSIITFPTWLRGRSSSPIRSPNYPPPLRCRSETASMTTTTSPTRPPPSLPWGRTWSLCHPRWGPVTNHD